MLIVFLLISVHCEKKEDQNFSIETNTENHDFKKKPKKNNQISFFKKNKFSIILLTIFIAGLIIFFIHYSIKNKQEIQQYSLIQQEAQQRNLIEKASKSIKEAYEKKKENINNLKSFFENFTTSITDNSDKENTKTASENKQQLNQSNTPLPKEEIKNLTETSIKSINELVEKCINDKLNLETLKTELRAIDINEETPEQDTEFLSQEKVEEIVKYVIRKRVKNFQDKLTKLRCDKLEEYRKGECDLETFKKEIQATKFINEETQKLKMREKDKKKFFLSEKQFEEWIQCATNRPSNTSVKKKDNTVQESLLEEFFKTNIRQAKADGCIESLNFSNISTESDLKRFINGIIIQNFLSIEKQFLLDIYGNIISKQEKKLLILYDNNLYMLYLNIQNTNEDKDKDYDNESNKTNQSNQSDHDNESNQSDHDNESNQSDHNNKSKNENKKELKEQLLRHKIIKSYRAMEMRQ